LTGKRIVLILGSLVVLAGAAVAVYYFGPWNGSIHVLVLPGVVEIQEVRLGSKVGGRVELVKAVEGKIAEPDDLLVKFEAPELRAQRDQAAARLQSAEADLDKANYGPRVEEKQAAQEATESAKAKMEMLKAGARPEEIREARSQYESADADLKLAREDYDRAERLSRQGTMSRADYDTYRAARERAAAQAAKAKAHLDLLLAGTRAEEIQQAVADYRKAKANYDMLLAGTRAEDIAAAEARVGEARGKLAELEANLKETEVRAPERCVLEVVAVRKGDLVQPNQPILRVLRADDLWVKVYVPETELGKVKLNQEVTVTIDAYPGRQFTGNVMQIASESEFTPRNVQSADERRHQVFAIKVRVPNPDGIFKSGMAAEVTIPLQ
jgi:multidrug resistance efflux pump